jgi:hypothetical protein
MTKRIQHQKRAVLEMAQHLASIFFTCILTKEEDNMLAAIIYLSGANCVRERALAMDVFDESPLLPFIRLLFRL